MARDRDAGTQEKGPKKILRRWREEVFGKSPKPEALTPKREQLPSDESVTAQSGRLVTDHPVQQWRVEKGGQEKARPRRRPGGEAGQGRPTAAVSGSASWCSAWQLRQHAKKLGLLLSEDVRNV